MPRFRQIGLLFQFGDLVNESLVKLVLQDATVGGLFGPNEGFELIERDLIIFVGGGDLLRQRITVGCVLEILTERNHEDVRSVLAEDGCERVGPVNEPRVSYRRSSCVHCAPPIVSRCRVYVVSLLAVLRIPVDPVTERIEVVGPGFLGNVP